MPQRVIGEGSIGEPLASVMSTPGAQYLGGAVSSFASSTMAAILSPYMTGVRRGVALRALDTIPDPQMMFRLFYQGILDRPLLRALLRFHGIDLRAGGAASVWGPLWNLVEASNRPYPDVAEIVDTYRRGLCTEVMARSWMARHGVTVAARQTYLLTRDTGMDLGSWIESFRRGNIGDVLFSAKLKIAGIISPFADREIRSLMWSLPDPSHLLGWLSADVVTGPTSGLLGLDDGYDSSLEEWYRRQGIGTTSDGLLIPVEGWDNRNRALLDWRRSRLLPTIAQSMQMLARLTPADIAIYQTVVPGVEPWSEDHHAAVMRASGYPPAIAKRISALQIPVITVRRMAQLYRQGVLDEQAIVQRLQAQQWSQTDAQLQATAIVRAERIRVAKEVGVATRARIVAAYTQGLTSRASAAIALYRVRMEDPVKIAEFDAEPRNQQMAEANGDPYVQAALHAADFDSGLADYKSQLSIVHRRYVKGAITYAVASDRLAQLGTQPDARDVMLSDWTWERNTGYKTASASQILRWYTQGLLAIDQATFRLVNIGYTPGDISLMLAQAQQSIASAAAKAQLAAARTQQQQQRARAAAVKAQLAQARAAQRQLCAHSQPAQLVRWLERGLITEGQALTRMVACGWARTEAAAYLTTTVKRGTESQTLKWYCQGLIERAEVVRRLAALGIAQADIDLLISSAEQGAKCVPKTTGSGNGQTSTGQAGGTSGAPPAGP